MKPSLGHFVDDDSLVSIDLARLLETRLLIQANSGQGKSRALRRLLEQTAGQVQQIILDPEGEFSSLREKHDLIICAAQGGDVVLHPRTAALLARRLRETKVSAVLDFSELHAHQRKLVARLFLEALVECPRSLWDPVLVVIDECQIFAPEKGHGESEALEAVADVTTRGRKRGLCLAAATLRISTLNKDVAAELKNRLIGGTVQDLDVKRLAYDLGMTPKDALEVLRNLDPGHFLAYGPALHQKTPRELITGDVFTTHPEVGKRRLTAPPKPTPAIVALLPKLADLPKEAETEARTLDDVKRELANARRELTAAKSAKPGPSPADLQAADSRGFERGVHMGRQSLALILGKVKNSLHEAVDKATDIPLPGIAGPVSIPAVPAKTAPAPRQVTERAPKTNGHADPTADGSLSPVQQRVLNALAELEQIGAAQPERELLAFMSGYSHLNSKGFANATGALRSAGMIEYRGGQVALTESGRAAAIPPDRPRTPAELQDRVVSMLGGASGKILKPLIQAYPDGLEREQLAAAADYGHVNSKGFANAMGRLRSLGFIDYQGRTVIAKPVLFLE